MYGLEKDTFYDKYFDLIKTRFTKFGSIEDLPHCSQINRNLIDKFVVIMDEKDGKSENVTTESEKSQDENDNKQQEKNETDLNKSLKDCIIHIYDEITRIDLNHTKTEQKQDEQDTAVFLEQEEEKDVEDKDLSFIDSKFIEFFCQHSKYYSNCCKNKSELMIMYFVKHMMLEIGIYWQITKSFTNIWRTNDQLRPVELIKLYLNLDLLDLCVTNDKNQTLFVFATTFNFNATPAYGLLLEYDSDVGKYKDSFGLTPIDMAMSLSKWRIYKQILYAQVSW